MTDEEKLPEEAGAITETEPVEPEAAEGEGDDKDKKPPKLTQQVEFRDVGPCKKHVKVTVDRADVDAKLDEQYSKLVNDAEVPGFRPGKAPRKIIERRFNKDVGNQVRAELLLQSLEQLAEEHDIAPLSAPNIDPDKIVLPDQGPLIYEFEVEVRPQFDLPNYKGLKLRRPVKKFTDADVVKARARLLEPHGQIVPKEPAAGEPAPKVAMGDIMVADAVVKDGDRVIRELKEVRVRVQPKLAFQDGVAEKLGEQVQGARPGETRMVDIQLSDRVSDAALRSKTVQAAFTVQDVKTIRLPEITHELCHQFGVHSEDQLNELIRVALERRLEYDQRQAARQQVLALINEAANWDLPRDLLARQARKALGRRVMEMRSAGIAENEIQANSRLLQQDSLRSTALALKEHFVLQKIAEVEKIDVNDDDLDAEIERLADQANEAPRRIRARMEKEDMLDALAAELVERKALDLILQNAEYEDIPVGDEEEPAVATVEEQAVPGKMHEPESESETPPAAQS